IQPHPLHPCITLFPYTTLFRSKMCSAVSFPGILPVKLIVALPRQCRLPRNLPSINAVRHNTLLLLRSPLAVRWIWPFVRIERLRSEEHTSELQSRLDLVCRLLL